MKTTTSHPRDADAGTENLSASEKIFISRQPLFDIAERVVGFHLLVNQGTDASQAHVPDNVNASARLIANTLDTFGLHQVLGDYIAFLPISSDSLASEFLDLLPPEKIVLEIRPTTIEPSDFLNLLRNLVAKGFRLALADFQPSPELLPLFQLASYVSFDLNARGLSAIAGDIKAIEHLPIKRIAHNLQSREDFVACQGPLFSLYMGSILTTSETLSMNRIDPSTGRVMQLFNLVTQKADIGVIEASLKHDVGLCYSLLCYINSAGFGMPYKVESIRNALMLLGYDFLWRWLSLLIFAGVDVHAGQRLLLNTALIRGRLTELLGKRVLSGKDGDQLFVVGIFSLIDSLLGMPMEKALENLNLPDEVASALLRHEGKYAPFLELTLAFEGNNLQQAEQLCGTLGLDLSSASSDHMGAIDWARQLA